MYTPRARAGAEEFLHDNSEKAVYAAERLLTAVGRRPLAGSAGLISECARQGSKPRLSEYAFVPLAPEEDLPFGYERLWGHYIADDRKYEVYLDAPAGIGLKFRGRLEAVCSVFPCSLDTLMIYQWQGIKPKIVNAYGTFTGERAQAWGLEPLDWRLLFTRIVSAVGQSLDYRFVAVRSGHNNPWTTTYKDGRIHLPIEEAVMKYDREADRLGFSQRENRDWYKGINKI